MNVEWINSIEALAYLFKYITKGSTNLSGSVVDAETDEGVDNFDAVFSAPSSNKRRRCRHLDDHQRQHYRNDSS